MRLNVKWAALGADMVDWLYSGDGKSDLERGCIGHLRGDFGHSGSEFWTSWTDHLPGLKTQAFKDEFQDVVNGLRENDGILKNFPAMNLRCRDGLRCEADSYGFMAQSDNYTYCLRCMPQRGNYNFYIYAYAKGVKRA